MTFTHALSTNNYGPAKWIVDASAANGTHTTIASALTSSSSGDTIFIRPGTYTENLTLKAGVNITSYVADGLENNVIILGKSTASGVGTFSISNVQLKTNSDFCLVVSGSSATKVNLKGVFINASNNTGVSFTTSNASALINFYESEWDLGTTGIAYWSSSSTGTLICYNCIGTNTGGSSTASSNSAGVCTLFNSNMSAPFSTSSTGIFTTQNSSVSTTAQNTTAVTTAGTGTTHSIINSLIQAGSASAISIGTGTAMNVSNSTMGSSNTNSITGLGTITYSNLSFTAGSVTINTTTQTGGTMQGGVTQAPSAGFLGEIIISAAGASITTGVVSNVATITLTPGIWNISGLYTVTSSGSITGTSLGISANTASFTGVSFGDSGMQAVTAGTIQSLSIPAFRVVVTTNTNYFLVQSTTFAGAASANGRISAIRAG